MLPRSRLDICILIGIVGSVCAALIPGSRLLIAALIVAAVFLVGIFPVPSGSRDGSGDFWSEYFWSEATPFWVRVVTWAVMFVLIALLSLGQPGSFDLWLP